jgi:hypothetical protein
VEDSVVPVGSQVRLQPAAGLRVEVDQEDPGTFGGESPRSGRTDP